MIKKIPCGGFSYDDSEIAFDNGVIHPIGGGGWPSDLPKPSVGGYGYTEQGEQTVITWDGDTEGRESLFGEMYLISEESFSKNSAIGAVISFANGNTLNVSANNIVEYTSNVFEIRDNIRTVCIVAEEDTDIDDIIVQKGVYFAKVGASYVTSIVYTPKTVHKIDEKYLPEAGGAVMIVNVKLDEETETIFADKTYTEIAEHHQQGEPVVLYNGLNFYDLQNIAENEAIFTKIFLGSAGIDDGRISAFLSQVEIFVDGTVEVLANVCYIAVSEE